MYEDYSEETINKYGQLDDYGSRHRERQITKVRNRDRQQKASRNYQRDRDIID